MSKESFQIPNEDGVMETVVLPEVHEIMRSREKRADYGRILEHSLKEVREILDKE